MSEGKIDVRGGKVWYRTWGGGGATPLLVLHGGPGMPSDYLHNMSALADERQVIVYDQLGCGRSDRPTDKRLFVAERFLQELGQVRDALALDEVHILGSSWGTALAVMYQLTAPSGVKSIILQGAYLSTRRWEEDNEMLLRAMPSTEKTINDHRRAGFTSCPEYAAALHDVYKRHLCRMDPWPADLHRSYEGSGDLVYRTMWGHDELMCDGNLKPLDLTGKAREIRVPTMIIVGEYDQCTPASAAFYQECIPGSELAVIKDASHLVNLERPAEFHATVRTFIARFD